MSKTFTTALTGDGKAAPFGGWRHHLSPAKAGALWVLSSAPHGTTGKGREVYSAPCIGVASELGS